MSRRCIAAIASIPRVLSGRDTGTIASVRRPVTGRSGGAGPRPVCGAVAVVCWGAIHGRGSGATTYRRRASGSVAAPPATVVDIFIKRFAVRGRSARAAALATIIVAVAVIIPPARLVVIPATVGVAVPRRGAGGRSSTSKAEATTTVVRGARPIARRAASVAVPWTVIPIASVAGAVEMPVSALALATEALSITVPFALAVASVGSLDSATGVGVVALDVETAHVGGGLAVAGGPHDVDDAVVAEDVGAVEFGAGSISIVVILKLDVSEATDFFGEIILREVDIDDLAERRKYFTKLALADADGVIPAAMQATGALIVTARTHGAGKVTRTGGQG